MSEIQNIEDLQRAATSELMAAKEVLRPSLPHLVHLVLPDGYKPKIQVSIQSKGEPGKVRKKRANAASESFDPRKDCLLVYFEPDTDGPSQPDHASEIALALSIPETPKIQDFRPSGGNDQRRAVVEALAKAESTRPQFVGLKYFRDRQMPHLGAGEGEEERRHQILREMIASGMIQTGKAHNPRNPEFPVTTIELNRQHPDVRAILDQRPSVAQSEFAPIIQRGELASRLILKDRR